MLIPRRENDIADLYPSHRHCAMPRTMMRACTQRIACMLLALVGLLSVPLGRAQYHVAVPDALSAASPTGLASVPNTDCIYAYGCAPLASTTSTVWVVGTTPVYIGRAAGRCQRKLHAHKCVMVPLILRENECRSSAWPDGQEQGTCTDEQHSLRATLHCALAQFVSLWALCAQSTLCWRPPPSTLSKHAS
jgi:hypothetical protein